MMLSTVSSNPPAALSAFAGAGAGAGGTLGLAGQSGNTLPLTGLSLGATVLASLLLMTLGFALRRRANGKS